MDTEPTVAEAQAEVEVALANEAEAREHLERAERATAAAQQAVAAAQKREDVSGNVTYLSQGSAAAQEREEHKSEPEAAEADEAEQTDQAGEADGDALGGGRLFAPPTPRLNRHFRTRSTVTPSISSENVYLDGARRVGADEC